MTSCPIRRPTRAGYSLLELTIATSVLAAGVAAAASLTMTSSRIEEMNHRKARVVALSEASARLWQLGLTSSQVADILPGDPALASMTFTGSTAIPNNQGTPVPDPATDLGDFQQMTITSSVLMREPSGATATDGLYQPLQPIIVIR